MLLIVLQKCISCIVVVVVVLTNNGARQLMCKIRTSKRSEYFYLILILLYHLIKPEQSLANCKQQIDKTQSYMSSQQKMR